MRRRYIVSFALFLVVLVVLAQFVDWRQVWELLRRARWGPMGMSAAMLIAGYVGLAWRWQILLRGKPDLRPTFHSGNAGNMLNTLLPLRPGDALRIVMLRGHKGLSAMQVASSLVVERWYESVMRVVAILAAFVFGSGLAVSHLTLGVVIGLLAASFAFMVWAVYRQTWLLEKLPPVLARLPRLSEEHARLGLLHLIEGFASLASPWRMAEGLFSSVLCWTLFWGFHYLALMAIAPQISRPEMLAISLASLALAPPSASTLPGVYQVSVTLPLALLGYDRNLLTSYSLVMNAIEMVFVNLFGVWGAAQMGMRVGELFKRKPS